MPIGLTPSRGCVWSWPTLRTNPNPAFWRQNVSPSGKSLPLFALSLDARAAGEGDSPMAAMHLDEQAIFEVARKIDSRAARETYLQQICGDDAVIAQRVRALLKAYEESASFLEAPAVAAIATLEGPMRERPGTVIGPYKLLEQIGEGGFGVVFMAEQAQPMRRKVALKVLKPGMDTRQVVARFEAERQALALMDHCNIAHVFDGGETTTGRPYFVMELVRGVPITDYCDQHQLTPRQRLELFVPVCQAVQHAHQKGIIHRDIKPSNVMVTLHDGRAGGQGH